MRVYSYIRFSSERQSHGDSVRRQLEKSREYCDRNGLVLDESFRLSDLGMSAFKGRNVKEGALAGFLADVEGGRVPRGSGLIIESLDRLSREQIPDALQLFIRILSAGINIITLTPERVHTRESINDLAGLIEPIVIMSRANEESVLKSDRSRQNWVKKHREAKSKKVMGKHCPWWVRLGDNGYELVPDRAVVVRKMFGLRADGKSLNTILKWLNGEGIKPALSENWNATMVSHILNSRATMGEYHPSLSINAQRVWQDPIEGYYPAVVSVGEFHSVSSAKAGRTGSRKSRVATGTEEAKEILDKVRKPRKPRADPWVNVFNGLAFAPDGHPYTIHAQPETRSGADTITVRRLTSSGALRHIPGSRKDRVPYLAYERGFFNCMKELDPKEFAGEGDRNVAAELADLSGRIADIETNMDRIKDRMKTSKNADVLLDSIESLGDARRSLLFDLEQLQSRASNHRMEAVGEIKTLATLLETASEEESRKLRSQIRGRLRSLVKRIDIQILKNPLGEKVGKRDRWTTRTTVCFHDRSLRIFLTDQDGKLIFMPNLKVHADGTTDFPDMSAK